MILLLNGFEGYLGVGSHYCFMLLPLSSVDRLCPHVHVITLFLLPSSH